MSKILSKDDILSANDIYIEEVHVPQWGGSVYVKTLTAAERDKLESELVEFSPSGQARKMKTEKLRTLLAVLGICDKDGGSVFTLKDIPLLEKKSSAALDTVVAKIQSLAGMSPADIEALTSDLKNDQSAALHSG